MTRPLWEVVLMAVVLFGPFVLILCCWPKRAPKRK